MKRKKLVAVSGGFDPIHIGHIEYLKEAKKLGDKLVVILNTDEFLRWKKGYVFMPYSQRKKILKSIKYVDEVIRCVDSDQTVTMTLQRLKPDVFAKGGDRTKENIPKAEVEACRKLGIELIVGVGGGKIQSSSWFVKKLDESMKASKKRE
jgi:glycerol-3-phosphate cytidylyltransferase